MPAQGRCEVNQLDIAVKALRHQLRDVEAERRQLARTERKIRAALTALNADALKGTAPRAPRTGQVTTTASAPLAQLVLAALPTDGSVVTTRALYMKVPGYSGSGIRNALSALNRAGMAYSPSRGRWRRKHPQVLS
jgi:hypothetical protein